ncbi:hypothetical protein [Mycoplasma struthionis]|uniref:Lipoprotein n=1 Tax=Mycoplasma struthionis TaxID=538220 RepID=A0A3G8LIR7_9MOLU|nr:hypothetical protein [Mycoplasma struthionis]AZG68782.1 hypothetical protein EGN60_02330 [Mycoplasma struthionis]
MSLKRKFKYLAIAPALMVPAILVVSCHNKNTKAVSLNANHFINNQNLVSCPCHSYQFAAGSKDNLYLSNTQIQNFQKQGYFGLKNNQNYDFMKLRDLVDKLNKKYNHDFLKITKDDEFKAYFDLQIPNLNSDSHAIDYALGYDNDKVFIHYNILCLARYANGQHLVEAQGLWNLEI